QRLALFHQRKQPAVGGITRGIDDAGDADAIAGLQRSDVGVRQRRDNVFNPVGAGAHAHNVTSLCRCAWHSITSEGGCAPLPNLPPSIAPAKPALEPAQRSFSGIATLTASLPCADARGIRW